MLSPSAHSHHGGQTGFSRWSTSHLNSNQTSPSVSTRGSFTRGGLNASVISGYSTASTTAGATGVPVGGNSAIRNSFRQPYLGWRSQEKLAQPRTPAERYVLINLNWKNFQSVAIDVIKLSIANSVVDTVKWVNINQLSIDTLTKH